MRYILLLFSVFAFSIQSLKAQLVVDNTNSTPEQLIQNVLLGGGVLASNITFNGAPANSVNEQVGFFNGVGTNVGLDSGIVMGSGNVTLAVGPNNSGSASNGGSGQVGTDPDLANITPNQVYDEAILEFDFIPSGDRIEFRYVFGSEEYNEYVCAGFNDAFGFFLTGPRQGGGTYNAENIALIPGTNTPVAINTVNNGTVGANGSANNCDAIDPNWASYNVYFAGNSQNDVQYDGMTIVLTAEADVICGESYHIKLAIGDAGDAAYDSGVFLEAGSFSSDGVGVSAFTPFANNVIGEDCGTAGFVFSVSDTTQADTLQFTVGGNATMGSDYNNLPNSIIISAGQFADTLLVNAFQDQLPEGVDTIRLELIGVNGCIMAEIYIQSIEPMEAVVSDSINICTPFESGTIGVAATGGLSPYSFVWSNAGGTSDTVVVAPDETTHYRVAITDQCGNYIEVGEVPVWVQCQIIPPNVFTPNGDGINDFFAIPNLDQYIQAYLIIYNRWGGIVYENEDYKNDWDGTHKNGSTVSDGIYYYIVKPNSTKYEYNAKEELKYTLSGHVSVLR